MGDYVVFSRNFFVVPGFRVVGLCTTLAGSTL